jgi:hypothetical protein
MAGGSIVKLRRENEPVFGEVRIGDFHGANLSRAGRSGKNANVALAPKSLADKHMVGHCRALPGARG